MLTSYSSLIKILLFDNQLLIFWMRSVVKFFSYVQDVRSCLFIKLPFKTLHSLPLHLFPHSFISHISIMYIAAFLICKEINYVFDIQSYNFL